METCTNDKIKLLIRIVSVFYILSAISNIIQGIIICEYSMMLVDVLMILCAVKVWSFHNPWRVILLICSILCGIVLAGGALALYYLLPEIRSELTATEQSMIKYAMPIEMALNIILSIILLHPSVSKVFKLNK